MCLWKKFKINRIKKKLQAMQQQRLMGHPKDDALKKEINLYHKLANIYLSLEGHKKFPFAKLLALEAYRALAGLDDIEAQFLLGRELIEEAKLRETLQEENLFVSQKNEELCKDLYKSGLVFLSTAASKQHVKALRLLGLCHINGWGVKQDQKKGMEYIIKSIDEENGWARIPQIFASIGLNKPEFFAALTQYRNQDSNQK